jgi:hypothetical protein
MQYLQDKNHITSIDNFEKVGLEKKKERGSREFLKEIGFVL